MKITDGTLCVADIIHFSIWDFSETMEQAQDILKKAKKKTEESITIWESHCTRYPDTEAFKIYLKKEKEKKWSIVTYKQYLDLERKQLLSDPLEEITEERFEEMLNVLPPLKWCTIDGIEMFCMSEMYTGSYTNQYAHIKRTNKFYTKMVDVRDKSTWINEYLRRG